MFDDRVEMKWISDFQTTMGWHAILLKDEVWWWLFLLQLCDQPISQHVKICFTIHRFGLEEERSIHACLWNGAKNIDRWVISHLLVSNVGFSIRDDSSYAMLCLFISQFFSCSDGILLHPWRRNNHQILLLSSSLACFGKNLGEFVCYRHLDVGLNEACKELSANIFWRPAKQLSLRAEAHD